MAEVEIRLRRNISIEWVRHDPILSQGEPGFEVDTGKLKIGDGINQWTALEYFVPEPNDGISDFLYVTTEELNEHVNNEAPHPVYDDGPSLTLLYNNAKV